MRRIELELVRGKCNQSQSCGSLNFCFDEASTCIIGHMEGHITERVTVRTTSRYGGGLFTRRHFLRGDVVFDEVPLLISLESTSPIEEQLIRRVSEQFNYDFSDDFVFLKSFCLSDEGARESVLSLFAPTESKVSSSTLLKSLCRLVDICKVYEWSKPYSKDTLRRAILVKACNAHGFNYMDSSSAALYMYGSRMNHSCKPNVVYTSQRKGNGIGSFIATTTIEPDDQLFISYIDQYQSTPMRQSELMENYVFKCTCDLCTRDIDTFRGLICPSCVKGSIFRTNATGVWNCRLCTESFTDSTRGLSEEEESELVESSSKFIRSFESRISQRLEDHINFLVRRVGRMHAVTKLAQKHFIEFVLLDRKNCDELISITDEILDWTENDPSFLDSMLIQIGCHIARIGSHFDTAKRYLKIVENDLVFLTGAETQLEQLDIVRRGLIACEKKDRDSVPDLVSPNEGCHIQ